MIPQFFTVAPLVQFGDADTVFVRRHMLGFDVHGDLAEIQIRADACRCRDAGGGKNVKDHLHGKFPCSQLVGLQIIGDVNEYLIDGVWMNVLGCYIFQIHLIDPGTVIHIVCHAWRCYDVVDGKRGILHQLSVIGGCAGLDAVIRILPFCISFLDFLNHFKQPGSARYAETFE